MENRFYTFVGGDTGPWSIVAVHAVTGPPLEPAPRLDIQNANLPEPPGGSRWLLRGVTSHQRYVTRPEQTALAGLQAGLGRPEATCAPLFRLPRRQHGGFSPRTSDATSLRPAPPISPPDCATCLPSRAGSIMAGTLGSLSTFSHGSSMRLQTLLPLMTSWLLSALPRNGITSNAK